MRLRIVLAERDPYVAFIVGLELPDAEIVEVEPDGDLDRLLDPHPDLMILDLDNPRAPDVLSRRDRPPLVGLLDGTRVGRPPAPKGVEVVLRPILPDELRHAVRRALGLQLRSDTRVGSGKARRWFRTAARMGRSRDDRSTLAAEANQTLSRLYDIARTMPEGLDRKTIADAALRGVRKELQASAGLLLLRESGMLVEIGAFGLSPGRLVLRDDADPRLAGGRKPALVRTADLPPALAARLGDHGRWLLVPLRRAAGSSGVLLAACATLPEGSQIRRLAAESSIALENASLFWRLSQVSVDRERQRLAAELHDGVAQSLMHLRLELDFLAGTDEPDAQTLRGEASRLARVAEHLLGDVRSMVHGLNASAQGQGLVGSLTAYLRDLQGLASPRIEFRSQGWMPLSVEVERELFRIAQEAVSNAIRHANAEQVTVMLDGGPDGLRLVVSDDGIGYPADVAGQGFGLESMRRRAERIEAALTTGPGPDGGTHVEVLLERDPGVVVISSGRRRKARR